MGLDLLYPFRCLERSLIHWLSGNPFPDWRSDLFFSDDNEDTMPSYITDITEYGLLLPNGKVLWSAYSNQPLTTPEEREMMVQVLRKTAEECGFTEDVFLSNYKWVSRRVRTEITDLGQFALDDPSVIGVDNPTDDEDYGAHDNSNIAEDSGATGSAVGSDSLGGDIREGSVGGVARGSA